MIEHITQSNVLEERIIRRCISQRGPRLFKKLQIVKCKISDYYKLEHLHYLKTRPHFHTNTYKVIGIGYYKTAFPDPIAVTVYGMPLCDIKARSVATYNFFKNPLTANARMRLINTHIRYAARLVVDCRFRKLGIGTLLAKATLPMQLVPIVETLTPLDWTAGMLERIGFKTYPTPAAPWYSRFSLALSKCNIHPNIFNHSFLVNQRISALQKSLRDFIEYEISLFIAHFRSHYDEEHSDERTKFFLSRLAYPQGYQIWLNPKMPKPWKNRGDPLRKEVTQREEIKK